VIRLASVVHCSAALQKRLLRCIVQRAHSQFSQHALAVAYERQLVFDAHQRTFNDKVIGAFEGRRS
jgi:hypothetical protein